MAGGMCGGTRTSTDTGADMAFFASVVVVFCEGGAS